MDALNRKRLEWMARARIDDQPPEDLFGLSWGLPACIAARAALSEIERLKVELMEKEHVMSEMRK